MTNPLDAATSVIDRIRHDLVGLTIPRALEALGHVLRRLDQGEMSALEAIDFLLSEELPPSREQPDQDRAAHGTAGHGQDLGQLRLLLPAPARPNRILTFTQLGFVERGEVVHSSARPAPARAIWPSPSASRPSRTERASTSARSPTSSLV